MASTPSSAPVARSRPAGPGSPRARERRRRLRRTVLWFSSTALAFGAVGVGEYVADPTMSAELVQELPATFVFPGRAPVLPWPAAGQAALAVGGEGRVGGSGPPAAPVPIASVAKVMTAYQVLIDHPLAPGAAGPTLTVLPDEAAAYSRQAAEGQSLVRVAAGERLTERQALLALMLASADNVAQILARWDAGSVPAFLERANRTAVRLGMTRSTYTDPSGLDPGTVSTAADQLLLAEHAIRDPAFAGIVGTRTAVLPVAGGVHNFNALLGQDGVVGVKTGSTQAAGGCLVFAADVPVPGAARIQRVYGVVLGQPGTPGTILAHAFTVAQGLLKAARKALGTATVAQADQQVAVVHRLLRPDRRFTATAAVDVVGWPGLSFTARVSGPVLSPALSLTLDGARRAAVTVPLQAEDQG